MYPRVPDSMSISKMSRCPDWSRTRSVWSTQRQDLFKSKGSQKSTPPRAAVTIMGTTITQRSNDLNFEYSIVTDHSFLEDKRTELPVPPAGRAIPHSGLLRFRAERARCDVTHNMSPCSLSRRHRVQLTAKVCPRASPRGRRQQRYRA